MKKIIAKVLIVCMIFGAVGMIGNGKVSAAKTYWNATIFDWSGSKIYFSVEEGSTGEYGPTKKAKITSRTKFYKAKMSGDYKKSSKSKAKKYIKKQKESYGCRICVKSGKVTKLYYGAYFGNK